MLLHQKLYKGKKNDAQKKKKKNSISNIIS